MRAFIIQVVAFVSICAGAADDSVIHIKDLNDFVSQGMVHNPFLKEQRLKVTQAEQKRTALIHSSILPELKFTGAAGPAPKYIVKENTSGYWSEDYDFTSFKPLLGFEFKMLQPLSFDKLRAGLDATQSNIELSKSDFHKFQCESSQNLQQLYYKYLFAQQMMTMAQGVKKQMEAALKKITISLENDDATVTQDNLFELKTYMFKVDDGLYQAQNGIEAATLAISFILKTQSFVFQEKTLSPRNDAIPELDSLGGLLIHNNPDLKKLTCGIAGQTSLVKLAQKEMKPDLFIFASFKKSALLFNGNDYKKSAELLNDPYNETEGSLGIGIRVNLNFWSLKDKYIKEKLELESLKSKELYAVEALHTELENIYNKIHMNHKRYSSAEISLNASESWLNSMAMKYDIDPSQISGLLKAYEKNIEAKKNYYQCVLDYNLAICELISRIGLTLEQYDKLTNAY